MKETGIVRQIDNLGRIVIPKELRRTLEINAGDSLEIFTDSKGVIMRKWQPDDSLSVSDFEDALILVCNETGKDLTDYIRKAKCGQAG